MSSIEFYTVDKDVFCKLCNGDTFILTPQCTDIVLKSIDIIEKFYPLAFAALCTEYEKSKRNISFYRYLIVRRFCKCNFGIIDNIPDMVDNKLNIEYVHCPLRGECKYEGVICQPRFNHQISDAEMRVLHLLYDNLSRIEIANRLYLSIHTVNNHIRNAYIRIGVKDTPSFIRFADDNKLFPPCTNNTK